MKVMRDIIGKEATTRELISYSMSHPIVASLCITHFGMKTLEENVKLIKEISRLKKWIRIILSWRAAWHIRQGLTGCTEHGRSMSMATCVNPER